VTCYVNTGNDSVSGNNNNMQLRISLTKRGLSLVFKFWLTQKTQVKKIRDNTVNKKYKVENNCNEYRIGYKENTTTTTANNNNNEINNF